MTLKKSENYFPALTGLRFFAALAVIGFHYFTIDNQFLAKFFIRGNLAVPFFFLLSGMVIAARHSNDDFKDKLTLKSYLKSRLKRLAPVYFTSIIMTLILNIMINIKNGEQIFGGLKSIGMVLTFLFLQTWIPVQDFTDSINAHSWSVSVEMFLYLTFPLYIGILFPQFIKNTYKSFLYLILFACLIYFLTYQYIPFTFYNLKLDPALSPYYSVPTFIFGIMAFAFYKRFQEVISKNSALLFGAGILILFAIIQVPLNNIFYQSANPLILLSFFLIILSCTKLNKLNNFLSSKLLQELGNTSYAMYMFQNPIKLISQQFWSRVLHMPETKGLPYCIYIAICITLFSWLFCRYLDRKLASLIK